MLTVPAMPPFLSACTHVFSRTARAAGAPASAAKALLHALAPPETLSAFRRMFPMYGAAVAFGTVCRPSGAERNAPFMAALRACEYPFVHGFLRYSLIFP